ncbi:hypothetical protein VN97_g10956 [Penicillium thymicola]|uniref:Uncharacterized protein n=1 Tax=Penicillium thymicola TaxID=293382 RepID=A0AAI9T8S0_PENTH|nr:hypothetical protein VN97_g10956 [Penicillium thymicola]
MKVKEGTYLVRGTFGTVWSQWPCWSWSLRASGRFDIGSLELVILWVHVKFWIDGYFETKIGVSAHPRSETKTISDVKLIGAS